MESHPDRDRWADAIAARVVRALAGAGEKTFIATGGSSPGPVYDRLASAPLDWANITVTLSDDRWVDEASAHSNAALVRRRLLVGPASAARFLPLPTGGAFLDQDVRTAEAMVGALPPIAVALLGMGEDGHIASLFPGDPNLAQGLNPRGERLCLGAPVAGLAPFVPRITLTMSALLRARAIVVMISGDTKRAMVLKAGEDPTCDLPVAALLRQTQVPVTVVWTP